MRQKTRKTMRAFRSKTMEVPPLLTTDITLQRWGFKRGIIDGVYIAPSGWRLKSSGIYPGYDQVLIDPEGEVRALIHLDKDRFALCPRYMVHIHIVRALCGRGQHAYATVIDSKRLGKVAFRSHYFVLGKNEAGRARAERHAMRWISEQRELKLSPDA